MLALCAIAIVATAACGETLKVTAVKIPKDPPPAATPATPPPEPPKKEIQLSGNTSIEGDQIKIKGHIEFDTDKATIKESNKETSEALNSMLEVLKNNPHITELHVEGHTDNKGKADHNKKLSLDRAQAVVDWLVKRGIEAKRLEAHGYGSERPKDTNDTAEGRQENRRVEFHIGEIDGKPFTK
jgi:OmpA-OmpF porin, OOP family